MVTITRAFRVIAAATSGPRRGADQPTPGRRGGAPEADLRAAEWGRSLALERRRHGSKPASRSRLVEKEAAAATGSGVKTAPGLKSYGHGKAVQPLGPLGHRPQ